MSMNQKNRKQRIFESIKINLLIILTIVFSCKITFAAENITIETKTSNFFENVVSDTILLLDPELKKIFAKDFDHVVSNSKFELQVNSWKPRPNPKIRLASIFKNTNSHNIRESFASLVQPVVEIACTPQKYDPLNEYQSKCIKELFKYPIIETIKIGYTFKSGTTIEQHIVNISNSKDKYRYQQIVCAVADIMNSAFEKTCKRNVAVSVDFVKYPLMLVAPSSNNTSISKIDLTGTKSGQKSSVILKEKQKLLNELDYLERNSSIVLNCSLREKERRIEEVKRKLARFDNDPSSYMQEQLIERVENAEAAAAAAAAAAQNAEINSTFHNHW